MSTMPANGSKQPRSSKIQSDIPRFLSPSPYERNWIRTIPATYPDILRAPAVTYKPSRDDERVSKNKYIAFARPYRGKQGLLIIGKEQRPVIIDESQPDRLNMIPMRLDRECITDTWIFTVSLYHAEGLIQMEDCIVANGEQIRSTKTFNERFGLLQRFAESIWYQDTRFQLNWQIKVADTYSLGDVKLAAANMSGGCLCLMPDLPTYRLIRVLPQTQEKPVVVGGPNDFICVGVEGKPDVYDLKNLKGDNVGRASIQTLTISQALQQKRSTGETIRVLAEWNEDFESYVVTSVI
jgi:hypothetical protein